MQKFALPRANTLEKLHAVVIGWFWQNHGEKNPPNNINILSIIKLYLFNPLICFFLIFYCAHHSHFLSDILKLEQIWITKNISWYYFIFVLLKLSLCLCQRLVIICTIGGSTWNPVVLGAGQRLCKKFVAGHESWVRALAVILMMAGANSLEERKGEADTCQQQLT